MEKTYEFLLPEDREKLATCKKKYGLSHTYVMGVHIDENQIYYSKPVRASDRKDAGLLDMKTSSSSKKLTWCSVDYFMVPPNCFMFLCTKEHTYQEVLVRFIRATVLDRIQKPEEGILFVAFSFPIHSLWEGARAQYQDFLSKCFEGYDWMEPIIVPFVSSIHMTKDQLCVYVDRYWTTFAWGESNKKISVSYGSNTEFRKFRCNDYLNNSTVAWTEKSYSSWNAGFRDIYSSVLIGNAAKEIMIFADSECRKVVESLFPRNIIHSFQNWANISESMVWEYLESISESSESSVARQPSSAPPVKKKISTDKKVRSEEVIIRTTRDLFEW